jgi:hypothetical protein
VGSAAVGGGLPATHGLREIFHAILYQVHGEGRRSIPRGRREE